MSVTPWEANVETKHKMYRSFQAGICHPIRDIKYAVIMMSLQTYKKI